jgi:hypothetical protein
LRAAVDAEKKSAHGAETKSATEGGQVSTRGQGRRI